MHSNYLPTIILAHPPKFCQHSVEESQIIRWTLISNYEGAPCHGKPLGRPGRETKAKTDPNIRVGKTEKNKTLEYLKISAEKSELFYH